MLEENRALEELQLEMDLSSAQPAVIGETDSVPDDEVPQKRIGSVVLPKYTVVPRANQLVVWMRRSAIFLLALSPLVWASDLYMPKVWRVVKWLDANRRSRITYADLLVQTQLNRSSPSAQGLRKDATAALEKEWKKFTAFSTSKEAPRPAAQARPAVYRMVRTDFSYHSPASAWPQMLLRNIGTFHGHSSMEGASSFLLEAPNGSHWIATSVHLLGSSGGVEPPLKPGRLAAELDRWRACLPDQPGAYAEAVGGNDLVSIITSDWLAMQLPADHPPLPVVPLKLRRTLLSANEEIYLVGLPYDDNTGVTQQVYRGHLIPSNQTKPGQFAFVADANVDFTGFRGAPVLDAEGLVVGVMTDHWADLLVGTRGELLAQLMEAK